MEKRLLDGVDLFSGIGGLTRALETWVRTRAYCERDRFCQSVLLSRMQTREIPLAPIWDDVRSLRRGTINFSPGIIFGGFPCQDISHAGRKGKGLGGPESGLWLEFERIVHVFRPGNVFIENVSRWKEWTPVVREALFHLGYDTTSVTVSAEEVGFPFKGSRTFVAASHRDCESALRIDEEMEFVFESPKINWAKWGNPPPESLGMVNGIPNLMDRVESVGNSVVPHQAREAFARCFVTKGNRQNGTR